MTTIDPAALDSVLVVRTSKALGDMLMVVPTLRALRAAAPRAQVALVGYGWAEQLVDRVPDYLDEFLEFPGWPGMPDREPDAQRALAFLAGVQARRADLAIQVHGNGAASNPFTLMLGARATAGFYLPGGYCPDPDLFLPIPVREHEVTRQLRLLAKLGVPPRGEHLEFPLTDADHDQLIALAARHGLDLEAPYACLHPGANQPARRWDPRRFAEVGDALAERGLQVVLTGVAGERPDSAQVRGAMRARAVDLAGHTSLGQVAALLAGARLLVSNDTGVAHLAASYDTPRVVIYRWSDPSRWAHPAPEARMLGQVDPLHVRDGLPVLDRCLRDGCRQLHVTAAQVPASAVTPAQVVAAADDLLAQHRPLAAGVGPPRTG